jgi:hypothetical protein
MDLVRSSDLTDLDVVATLGFNLQSWDLVRTSLACMPDMQVSFSSELAG